MSAASIIDRNIAETLRSAVAGEGFARDDDGYDDARRAFDPAAHQRPAVGGVAASAADVLRAVRFANSHLLRIAPQNTGHGAATLESLESAMLLKTSRLRRVQISPEARRAYVEANAQWRDVTDAVGAHGLAALAASS